jgi:putative flippase GtrA
VKNYSNEFIPYVCISLIALILDCSLYWLLCEYEILSQAIDAVIGYLFGLIFAYFMMRSLIFKDGWLKDKRIYEALLFGLSGLLGAITTYLVVLLYGQFFQEKSHIAKIAAIGISFITVYLFRKKIIFKSAKD